MTRQLNRNIGKSPLSLTMPNPGAARVEISRRFRSLIRSILSPFLGPVIRIYRTSDFKWRYVDNFRSSFAYRFGRDLTPISRETARILSELDQNGVAITSAEALFGGDPIYRELVDTVGRMESDLSDEIVAARAKADDIDPLISKTYTYFLCGRMERPIFDPKDVLIRFPLSKPILEIVNAYFQMYARLCRVNIWHTFPTRKAARSAQLWHHDPEDRYILKVFVYLSDVDNTAGPFTFARGTHPKGMPPKADFLDETGRKRVRVNDVQMATAVPVDRWIECVGRKGTIIFADTRGYHKGGQARQGERIMYQCTFVSGASQHRYVAYSDGNLTGLNKAQHFALDLARQLVSQSIE